MNFTYYQEEECLILCTRKDTKKYQQIKNNPKIAVLIHDFPHLAATDGDENHGKTFSVTLNGYCEVYDAGNSRSEKYRNIHLTNNPNYSQFICGNDIAVIKIFIEKARICDFNDKVSYWNNKDGVTCSE
mmetsp:Transcript_1247/g.1294  ORF Transcript_1247/g.1294 Transcript_1247/m.1294 type:complete len:129 (+) Transcript_1247:131-517(+)